MAKVNDFNAEAEYYDLLEKKNQALFDAIVDFLAEIFRNNGVKKIIDFTCGAGAQAIPLSEKGFNVVGIDIAGKLLDVAKSKSKNNPNISFKKGDVRNSKIGEFDAAISMLNSLGYLPKNDFKKALANINKNLEMGGLFVFDNTNKECLDAGNFIADKIIDTAGEDNKTKFVRLAKSKYNKKSGIIITEWEAMIQKGFSKPIKRAGIWKRQVYSKGEIEDIFAQTGFEIEEIRDRNLGKFNPKTTFSYLIIAKKIYNLF